MSAKVGIVLVSYNASTAVRTTLASLRAAANATDYELVLVDNASREEERVRIRRAFERHVADQDLPWTMVQEAENLGFSGGNNVGIRRLLADASITHVCLLNSDVIVTTGWLDRLVATGEHVVSAVTNKAESEQCVPAGYDIELESSLDEASERLRAEVFTAVDEHAAERRRAFAGHVVDCDATFFCVLLSRAALERIGELDETFFPGGYEDDDYCLRARAAGFAVHVARDVYLHHWGSASFGRLDFEYFNSNAQRNRSYLEQKHGITCRRSYEKPFVSFAQDVAFVATGNADRDAARGLLERHARDLDALLRLYLKEFRNLYATLGRVDSLADQRTDERAQLHAVAAELDQRWQQLRAHALSGVDDVELRDWREQAGRIADDVHRLVEQSFGIHALLAATDGGGAAARVGLLRRAWSLIRHGVPFVLRLRGVVFVGGYPYAAREKDGYFQRIRAIDGMFDDRWRIYFDPEPLPGQDSWYDLPAHRTLVLRGGGGRLRLMGIKLLVWLLAMRCRFVYFHSVLRMHDLGFGRLLRLPFSKRVLDVHGVVPEEFRMHDDFYSGRVFDKHEEAAAARATTMIVVTEAMRAYLVQKYGQRLRAEVVVLPIFPGLEPSTEPRPYRDGRPVVVYAGGLHKWQQVPLMVDAIERTIEHCDHRFYCTDPDAVVRMLSRDAIASGRVVVDSKSHEELIGCYREAHFGFLLRADNVVNRVACPTKMVEYLAMGIVPIFDGADVGDFVALGVQYLPLEDLLAGRIPTEFERAQMVANNFEVYGRLRAQREAGAARLQQVIGRRPSSDGLVARAMWQVGKLLPADTVRGRVVRGAWHRLRGRRPALHSSAPADPAALPGRCDVLVQVGHFLAGGLENVVIELNQVLQQAGYRVGMLVLGDRGPAVERVQQQGVEVFAQPYSDDGFRRWLAAAQPRVVMGHYSVEGAAICRQAGVPHVQIIHNIYLWLQGEEMRLMKAAADDVSLFVAVSQFAKDFSVRRLGVPAERCVVIPGGIDVERFRDRPTADERQRMRRSLGIDPQDFVFLNAAAINHQKNHLSLLRSFLAIRERCPRARLVIIGPVYERELFRDCEQFVARHDLAGAVTFVGPVADPHRFYGVADAYVHSAFFEGGPLTVLEAIAADLPVITVATGIAVHFRECRGVHVVPAHFDVVDYRGHITAMKSSHATEQAMSDAMSAVYREPVRPELPAGVIESFDRENAYRTYVELVRGLVTGITPTTQAIERLSWARRLSEVS